MTENALEISPSQSDASVKNKGLSSIFYQVILFLYTFFFVATTVASYVVGLTGYVAQWNLSYVFYINTGGFMFLTTTVSEFIVSTYADKSESKYGRRKPYVVLGYIISSIGTLMVCIPPAHSGTIVPVWFLLSSVIAAAGRGISTNPFSSWIIESCIDNAEYRALTAIPFNIGALIGALFGGLLVIFIPAVGAVASVAGYSISTFLLVYYIPSIVHQQVAKLPPLIPSMRIASRTNEFRTIFTNRVLIGSATGIFGTAASFLFLIGFGLSTTSDFVIYSILLAVVGLIVSLIVNIGMNWLLRYVEKLRVYLIFAAAVTVLSTIAFIPANFTNTSAFVVLFIFTLILSIISQPIGLIESLMVRDLIVYDTFITGLNRQNTYYTAITVPTAILIAVITAIPVAALNLSGFKQNAVDDDNLSSVYSWTTGSIWICRICCGIVTPIIAGLSYYLISKYPLTQKISDQINDAVRRKEEKAAGNNEPKDVDDRLKEAESGAVSSAIDEESRLVILHLSLEEILRVACGTVDQSTGQNMGLQAVNRVNLISLLLSGLTSLLLVVSYFIDTIMGSSEFSTLLLALFLLVFSLFTYEAMRRGAIIDTGKWEATKLKAVAKAVYLDFSTYHETLKEKLSRGAVDVTEEEDTTDDTAIVSKRTSLFIPIQDVQEVKSAGGNIDEDRVSPARGYKRIYSSLMAVIALTIIVICLDTR